MGLITIQNSAAWSGMTIAQQQNRSNMYHAHRSEDEGNVIILMITIQNGAARRGITIAQQRNRLHELRRGGQGAWTRVTKDIKGNALHKPRGFARIVEQA